MNPLFECSLAGGHNHAHLKNFSDYSVTTRGEDAVVVRGHKEGFCLVNSLCKPDVVAPPNSGLCNVLSAGCADFYGSGLGCQYVDITDVKPGDYTLRVELNPLRTISEVNYLNNVQVVDFQVCKSQPSTADITIGVGDQRYQGKRPLTLRATVGFASERELRSFDPLKDGVAFTLNLEGREVLGLSGASLPPGKVGKGCYPTDGWSKSARNRWEFRSDSGLDQNCSFMSTGGVYAASVEKRGNKLYLSARARVEATSVARIPQSGRLTLTVPGVIGDSSNDTCGKSVILKGCRRGGPGKSILVCR